MPSLLYINFKFLHSLAAAALKNLSLRFLLALPALTSLAKSPGREEWPSTRSKLPTPSLRWMVRSFASFRSHHFRHFNTSHIHTQPFFIFVLRFFFFSLVVFFFHDSSLLEFVYVQSIRSTRVYYLLLIGSESLLCTKGHSESTFLHVRIIWFSGSYISISISIIVENSGPFRVHDWMIH